MSNGRVQFDQPHPISIKVDEEPWAPESVFGSMLTQRDEYDVYTDLDTTGQAADARAWVESGERDRIRERDRKIIRVARRWKGDPLTPPSHGNYVAGDVAAIRTSICEGSLQARHDQRNDQTSTGSKLGSSITSGLVIDLATEHWLYRARSYFVAANTLIGLVDCELPTAEELDDIRLPADYVTIYFGGDLTIPHALLDSDNTLAELARRVDNATLDNDGFTDGTHAIAQNLSGPLLAVQRRQPVQLTGVALRATADGRIDDTVLWLANCPEHHIPNRHALHGRLTRSSLRYIAINIAAAITWGQWHSPNLDDLPPATDPRFRDVIRSSRFRKAEPHGGALGVHVLDVQRTINTQPNRDDASTHASPATHTRRAHWNRYRVGPRDDWHYERRFIPRTIVNPGHHDDRLTIYRLPPPPQ